MRIFLTVIILATAIFHLAEAKRTKRPRAARIRDCYLRDDYYFCNHGDRSVKRPKPKAADTYGWCCPIEYSMKNDRRCLNKGKVECTLPVKHPEDQGKPLYMTYWPGQTLKKCNQTSVDVTATQAQ